MDQIRMSGSFDELTSDVKSLIKTIVQAQSDLPSLADNAGEAVASLFEDFATDDATRLGNMTMVSVQTETIVMSVAPDLESIKVRLTALLRHLDRAALSACDMTAKRKSEARTLLG